MTTDLVIRDTDTGWSSEQLAVLRHMGVEGAPREELQVFHHQCNGLVWTRSANRFTCCPGGKKPRKPVGNEVDDPNRY